MKEEIKNIFCPQCGKVIDKPISRTIIQRDNRALKGMRMNKYVFCSEICGGNYQMACEG